MVRRYALIRERFVNCPQNVVGLRDELARHCARYSRVEALHPDNLDCVRN
jgi:hypothetical protein